MAGHAQLKFVTTECSKTQIRLAGLTYAFPLAVKLKTVSLALKDHVYSELNKVRLEATTEMPP